MGQEQVGQVLLAHHDGQVKGGVAVWVLGAEGGADPTRGCAGVAIGS